MYLYATLPHQTNPNSLKLSLTLFISSPKTMKKESVYYAAILLFLLFIISSSKSSARFLETKQGEEDQKVNEIISGTSLVALKSSEESADQLMGMEECDKEDDECLKRRTVAEAHLDYIYTQYHKP